MKLLRVGSKGKEKPGVLDKEGKIRDISSHISDLNPENLNFTTISKIQGLDLSSLPELSPSERVGSCIDGGGNVYPLWENGTPNTDNSVHFSECTEEWYDGLSKDDYSAFLEWHTEHNLSIYDKELI